MKYTNKHNLPKALYEVIAREYDVTKVDPKRISVTTLINPPLQKILQVKYWNDLEEDVADSLWALTGQAYHFILAKIADNKEKSKERFIEEKIEIKVDEFTIVAKLDLYDNLLKSIEDYKITCLPLESEALTRNGWKKYNELKIGEEILAYDMDKDITRWTPLVNIQIFPKAELVRLKSKSFDFKCTWNHKWFIERNTTRNKKRFWDKQLIETKNFQTNHKIISAAYCPTEYNLIDITEEEASILGWIVTDGDIVKGRDYSKIYQSKEPFRSEIREKFKNWIRVETIKTKNYKKPLSIFWLHTQKIRDFYRRINFSSIKDLPSIVTRLSSKNRKAMLDSFWKAEGDGYSFAQNPTSVYDAFQILMTLEGKRLSISKINNRCYYTSPIRTRYVSATRHCKHKPIYKEISQESVWCPTTKYNSFVTRQGRQITITGNSVFSAKMGVKSEWEKQLNLYAWALRKSGFEVNEAFINAILRDWRKNEKFKYDDYPEIPFKRIKVNLWTLEEQEKYVQERVNLYRLHMGLPIEEVPICSPAERWQKKDVYAIQKKSVKKATKLCATEKEANDWIENHKKPKENLYVVKRPGSDLKCLEYCTVAPFCTYYKETYVKKSNTYRSRE